MKFNCPQCGGECHRDTEDITVTCYFCGTELLVRDADYEVIDDHAVVEAAVSRDQIVQQEGEGNWKLIYFPFWVTEVEYTATFVQRREEEGLLSRRVTRDLEAKVSLQGKVYVPARDPVEVLGLRFQAAMHKETPGLARLDEVSGGTFRPEMAKEATFLHGRMEAADAEAAAMRAVEWSQKDSIQATLPNSREKDCGKKVSPPSLLHRPFWTNGMTAVDAVTGDVLAVTPPSVASVKEVARNRIAFHRLAIGAACCWGAPLVVFLLQDSEPLAGGLIALMLTIVGVLFLLFFIEIPTVSVTPDGIQLQSEAHLFAVLVYIGLALLYSVAPLLLLAVPIGLMLYPFGAAVHGAVSGKGVIRSFGRGVKQAFIFFTRFALVVAVYVVSCIGTLTAVYIAFY